jgi:hypothetical protein
MTYRYYVPLSRQHQPRFFEQLHALQDPSPVTKLIRKKLVNPAGQQDLTRKSFRIGPALQAFHIIALEA